MALGGLAVLLVLGGVAALGARWYRTYAHGPSAQPVADTPQQAQAQPVQPVPEPAAAVPAAAPTPPTTEAAPVPAAVPATPPVAVAKPQRIHKPAPAEAPVSAQAPPPVTVPEPVRPPQPAVEPAPPPPSAPVIDEKVLRRVEERMGKLSARVNAVRGGLENLQRRQRSQGYGLRGDIVVSWKRMEFLMDEAQVALRRQNINAARRNLTLAEEETDKLEQFLGR